MANHFSILALRTPWTVWKGQKDRTLKDEIPRLVGAQYATGDQRRNNFRNNKETEPKQKQHPGVDMTGDGSKVQCCKWNVRSIQFSSVQFSSGQSLGCVWLFSTPWTAAWQASLPVINSQTLLKLVHWVSDVTYHLILCRPLLIPPSIFPRIRGFSNESVLCIRWPRYWSFSFSISPSNEHSGLISFRMDWLDLLAIQGTLKNILQHHSSKPSILWCSAFFIVQHSHLYMTTGKIIALTGWIFVGKVMSLLFNMLSRLAITFIPRSKPLLISWLQSLSAVMLEPPK